MAGAALEENQRIAGESLDGPLVAVRSPLRQDAQAVRQVFKDQQVLIVIGAEIDPDVLMAGGAQLPDHRPQALQRFLWRSGTGHARCRRVNAACGRSVRSHGRKKPVRPH